MSCGLSTWLAALVLGSVHCCTQEGASHTLGKGGSQQQGSPGTSQWAQHTHPLSYLVHMPGVGSRRSSLLLSQRHRLLGRGLEQMTHFQGQTVAVCRYHQPFALYHEQYFQRQSQRVPHDGLHSTYFQMLLTSLTGHYILC